MSPSPVFFQLTALIDFINKIRKIFTFLFDKYQFKTFVTQRILPDDEEFFQTVEKWKIGTDATDASE